MVDNLTIKLSEDELNVVTSTVRSKVFEFARNSKDNDELLKLIDDCVTKTCKEIIEKRDQKCAT